MSDKAVKFFREFGCFFFEVLVMYVVKKTVYENISDLLDEMEIEKANSYGRKIPIKKMTSDGRQITYWVSPEDLNQGKMKGQQNLFDDDELADQDEGEDSYYSNWDKETYELRIKPLIREMEKVNEIIPGLSKRINQKYGEYNWDRETRDLDIQLDFDTLEYMKKVKQDPENKEYYYETYLEKTDKAVKKLNNRKAAMARIKKNSKVKFKGQNAKVTGFSERGFPIIQLPDGKTQKCFVDEIADIDSLIEKYSTAA